LKPPENEKVERVASAIEEAHKPWSDFYAYPFDDTNAVKQIYRTLARAALKEIEQMPAQKITCAGCGANLTDSIEYDEFRLLLQSERRPNRGGGGAKLQAAEPPLARAHHFCGLECLDVWRAASKASWGVGNSFEYDPINVIKSPYV
jgi:hypothetical protein